MLTIQPLERKRDQATLFVFKACKMHCIILQNMSISLNFAQKNKEHVCEVKFIDGVLETFIYRCVTYTSTADNITETI